MNESPIRRKKKPRNTLLWGIMLLGFLLLFGTVIAAIYDHYPNPISHAMVKLMPADPVPPTMEHARQGPIGQDNGKKLGLEHIEGLLKTLTLNRRAEVLADAAAFERLVKEEAARLSVLDAARASGLRQDERIAYLMARASDQILFNTFMQVQARSNLPAGFPTEEQVQRYYEQNRAKYRLEQHVPIWQVFIGVPPNASAVEEAQIEAFATDLSDRIRTGKLSFADAALSHSEHDASRIQGGYMGAIRVSQLLPEVRDALPELKEGDVSRPMRAKEGYHIVKRGAIIAAQDLPLSQIRGTIEMELRRAAVLEIQRAVVNASVTKYGTALTAAELEAWRSKMSSEVARSN